MDAQNAVGRWQMLALAIRTRTLALDGGFGHPTSLRPSSDVEFCHPEPLESTLVCGSGHQNIAVVLRQLSLVSPHPPWRHQDREFGLPEPFGSTSDVGFGHQDVGWRFWLPHIHHTLSLASQSPLGQRWMLALAVGTLDGDFGCPTSIRTVSLATQSPLGQRWTLPLAVGTLGDDFGCPTSIRP